MSESGAQQLPLHGLTVLDLTRVRAGPTAVRQLADWGAFVVKIEAPQRPGEAPETLGGPRHGPDFQNLHRNKTSMTLDLRVPAGRAALHRMARQADVLIENYRPAVKRRLGISYRELSAVNPRLVYGSISGFGQDGPYAERPGVDQIAQGMGGLMSVTGQPGQGPVRAGTALADLSAGLYCALGVLIALLDRQRSGRGTWIRTSLLEAQIAMMDFQAARWLIGGEVPPQAGNDHPTSIPTGFFPTQDGEINIAASGDRLFRRLCQALDLPRLADDPDYADGGRRSRNRHALNALIAERTRTRPSADWIARFNEAGVPSGPIYRMDEVFADPQVQHLRMAVPVQHPHLGELRLLANPIQFGDLPRAVRSAAPEPGAETEPLLRRFGFSADEISDLRDAGAV